MSPTPHASRIPADWPRPADHPAFLCTNCGFWQKHFAVPPDCPVCRDARHVLPDDGWRFLSAEEVDRTVRCSWTEVEDGIWRFGIDPPLGIGPNGYLIEHPDGNVGFEAAGWYDEAALEHIAARGGIAYLSASHPHTYGALWRLAERFEPDVVLHRDDLGWATAFGVTWAYDERLEPVPGLAFLHTGGHFPGHHVLHDADRRILFCGDALKLELVPGDPRRAHAASAHKAFVRQVPLTKGEVRRYREVFAGIEFDQTWTPFEQARNADRAQALRLLDDMLASRPYVAPLEYDA